jgi:hypothetical protein
VSSNLLEQLSHLAAWVVYVLSAIPEVANWRWRRTNRGHHTRGQGQASLKPRPRPPYFVLEDPIPGQTWKYLYSWYTGQHWNYNNFRHFSSGSRSKVCEHISLSVLSCIPFECWTLETWMYSHWRFVANLSTIKKCAILYTSWNNVTSGIHIGFHTSGSILQYRPPSKEAIQPPCLSPIWMLNPGNMDV